VVRRSSPSAIPTILRVGGGAPTALMIAVYKPNSACSWCFVSLLCCALSGLAWRIYSRRSQIAPRAKFGEFGVCFGADRATILAQSLTLMAAGLGTADCARPIAAASLDGRPFCRCFLLAKVARDPRARPGWWLAVWRGERFGVCTTVRNKQSDCFGGQWGWLFVRATKSSDAGLCVFQAQLVGRTADVGFALLRRLLVAFAISYHVRFPWMADLRFEWSPIIP